MTPAIVTPNLARRQGWARRELGLAAGAAQEEVEAAIWEHLEAANLTPSAAERQAIRLLCDPQAPGARPKNGCDACLEAREYELLEEMESFSEQFFLLPCDARQERWARLLNAAEAFPRIRLRLLSWERGLEIEPGNFATSDPQEKLLAERVSLLFLLKLGDRTRQRRCWLAETEGDWKAAVQRFRRKHAKLATLDVDFLRGLETPHNESRSLQGALARQPKIAPTLIAATKPANAPVSPLRSKTANAGNAPAAFNSKWSIFWLIVVVISMVMRGMDQFNQPISGLDQHNQPTPSQPDTLDRQRMNEILRRLRDSSGSNLLHPQPTREKSEDEVWSEMSGARSTATSPSVETGRLPGSRPLDFSEDEPVHPTNHDRPESVLRDLAPSSPRGSAP